MGASKKYRAVAPSNGKDDRVGETMWVLRVSDVLKLERIEKHETLKAQGLLVEYKDGMNPVLFCSHTWLGWTDPDCDGQKITLLKDFLTDALAAKRPILTHYFAKLGFGKMDIPAKKLRSDLEEGYVWLDFWSVPQEDPIAQRRSIDSIDQYVARAAYFSVLAGAWKHADDGSVRDQRAWCGRGWCRLELLANALSPVTKPIIICQSRSAIVTHGNAGLPSRYWSSMPVCEGAFTVEADKAKLRPALQMIIENRLQIALDANDMNWFRGLHAFRRRLLDGSGDSDAAKAAPITLDAWLHTLKLSSVHDMAGTGVPPLVYACYHGDLELVRAILDVGAAVDARTKRDFSPLYIMKGATALMAAASIRDTPELIELLLERGADPFVLSAGTGATAFCFALMSGNIKNCEALVRHSPSLLKRAASKFGGMTPMVVSVFGGRSNVFEWMTATDPEEAKRWLGPPASSGDSFGLSLAAHVINQVGDVDLLRSVVRAGCDVNAAALKGSHPQINMIYTLSDLACWLTRPSPFFEFWSYSCRCSPLHCAVYNANLTAVEALLELKADVNSRVHVHKMTPLHLAAQGGHTLIAQRLLDSGADPCARDGRKRDPCKWAKMRGNHALAELLHSATLGR